MRVAIVHDDLVQWGGAERVLLAISELFSDAPIYTSVFNKQNKTLQKYFGSKKIITSFMQNIPGWRNFHKSLLPLYPIAFEQFDFSQFDLVISHTTRFAKSIITKPETKHICFCHTPPRFLWNFSGEKPRKILSPYLSFLRIYDQISSKRVDAFWAGSENAKKRIKKVYGMDSKVCYPFVDLDAYKNIESFEGGYYLLIARLNQYKRADIAIDVFNKSGEKLKIIGVGPKMGELKRKAKQNIEFLGGVSEEVLKNVIAGCSGLIVTAEEDFGLTALEAQAAGKAVIAYGKGGSLETLIDGQTGVFFLKQTAESLEKAVENFKAKKFNAEKCKENARRFSKKIFEQHFLELIKEMG